MKEDDYDNYALRIFMFSGLFSLSGMILKPPGKVSVPA